MVKVPLKVRYSKQFEKDFLRAPQKVQLAFRKRRELFQLDQNHPQLRNHALTGKYKGLRSINITGDWRALYAEQSKDRAIEIIALFHAIGTHSKLYK
jgi:addiction module RelE/StbE family toxin